jgi:hypothetical protein
VTKAPIDWNHLNADDHEKLEKMMAPYHAIEDQSWGAMAKGKRGGTIGHSAMRVLEAFFTFTLRRPGESLHLSHEAIAEAAVLSPRTVGRAIQRLPTSGSSPSRATASMKSPRRGTSADEPQTTR